MDEREAKIRKREQDRQSMLSRFPGTQFTAHSQEDVSYLLQVIQEMRESVNKGGHLEGEMGTNLEEQTQ